VKFSLATTETYKDNKGQTQSLTEWHSIILWRGLADLAEKYLRKGTTVYLVEKNKTRSYDDKQGSKRYVTEIIRDRILILDKKEP
jgi:single-strand DNA-binding protein